jgi:hypothetical protein
MQDKYTTVLEKDDGQIYDGIRYDDCAIEIFELHGFWLYHISQVSKNECIRGN